MKETQPIQLPPRQRREEEGHGHSSVALTLWVITALMIGVSVGIWFTAFVEPEDDFGSGRSFFSVSSTGGNPEVEELILNAQKAMEIEGDWSKARSLYAEALTVDEKNQVAMAALPIIDQYLGSIRGSVVVETLPSGAEVRVGTFAAQNSPATFEDLPPGEYPVEISLAGFQPVKRNVSVTTSDTITLDAIQLAKAAGTIEVTSLPSGLAYQLIKRDGQKLKPIKEGTTPERIDELPEGQYEVKMAREGWPAYSASVEVQHNRNASVSHVFESGGLNVMSDPPSAEIWVKPEGMADYKKVGQTPMGISDLPVGKVALELRYEDWPTIRRTVEVVGSDMEEPLEFVWKRGLVSFVSDPPHAEIFKDGKPVGDGAVTPFSMEIPEGDYQFTAVYPRLDSVTKSAEVTDGEDNPVNFDFAYGTVELDSTPTGAGVILDGKPIGKTPLRENVVRPGTYIWKLQKDKFQSTEITGEVRPGQSMNFSAELTYDPTPKIERGFANGVGLQMVWVPSLGGWVGATEVTQEAYELLTGENPSEFVGPRLPVDSVSWYEANDYCEKLTNNEAARDALPRGYTYRLPSDTEWSAYVGNATLRGAVTSQEATRTGPIATGSRPPNEFGLYDVRGNVWEWCRDWYSLEIVNQMQKSGVGGGRREWTGTARKVLRGGAWSRSNETDLAVEYRLGVAPEKKDRRDCGFRVVLMPR